MKLNLFLVMTGILLCGLPRVGTQSIDEESSGFLSAPNARTGCYSPFRLVIETEGADTIEVQSVADGVVLTQRLAAGRDRIERVVPVLVGESAAVRVGSASFRPALPTRRISPDYDRPYAAVFSPDPLGARAVLPSIRERMVCDHYELDEFFTDWRLLDAYDALVIFNPNDSRLPTGSQRTIAEFCSLGGVVFIGGSFRLGESAVDVPAPVGPQAMTFRGTPVRRFGYGAGAIYRAGWTDLTRSSSAQLLIREAIVDQLWFGAASAPGGEPESRVVPERAPLATPLPADEARPGPLFFGLAGGLLLLALIAPLVVSRLTKRRWVVHLCVAVGATGIGGGALLQDSPAPVGEVSEIHLTGEGAAVSTWTFQQVRESGGETLTIELVSDNRLPKALPTRAGWNAWLVFEPLTGLAPNRAPGYELAYGRVGDETFRDFATNARRGRTRFNDADAWLVEWWLERNAWRGRFATLSPVEWRDLPARSDSMRVHKRGAIRVIRKRQ